MKKLLLLLALVPFAIVLDSCQKFDFNPFEHHQSPDGKKENADVATDWYKLQLTILLERNSALNGINFAYIGVGLYESVRNANDDAASFSGKLYQMPTMPAPHKNNNYNWQVSANAAMADMVRSFYTGLTVANSASIDSLENAWNQKLKRVCTNASFDCSQAFGRSIAKEIYGWFLIDKINGSNTGYVPPVFAGAWVPTPPALVPIPVNPYLGASPTFLASNATSVSPVPTAFSETAGSDFYKMAKKVYDVSQSLTTEQKNIALYWVDNGNGIGLTTAGHEMSIVTQAIAKLKTNLVKAAEAYAKAGIAERDGAIVCFRSKYKYNLIRPVSYIQKLIDPAWLPFIVTPPHPEYPAAHAEVTGAVMQAVSHVLGYHVSITDHSYDFRGWAPRSFNSLFAAAQEAGISRVYGGIHYLPSVNEGLLSGKDVGDKVGNINLTGNGKN